MIAINLHLCTFLAGYLIFPDVNYERESNSAFEGQFKCAELQKNEKSWKQFPLW